MERSVLVDAGFLVALLSRRDTHHRWAASQTRHLPPPWFTCEAVLSEAFHLLGSNGRGGLAELIRRDAVVPAFELRKHVDPTLELLERYANVPMSFADACLVRMTEISASSLILTTDSDFRIYRRNGRKIVPCLLPEDPEMRRS